MSPWVGELTPNGFSRCRVPALPPELLFPPPHFLHIVVEVKVSRRPRLNTVVGVDKGMLPVNTSTMSFLYQSYFMEILGLSQS